VRAVLVGAGSGLLVGVVALVALVGFGWPVDHRVLTTTKDSRPVVLPQSFVGMPAMTAQDPMRLANGGRPTGTVMYGRASRFGSTLVGVAVSRSWTSGDSDVVSGPTTRHGAVVCHVPVTFSPVYPDESETAAQGEYDVALDLPAYCERRTDTLTVSALVIYPSEAPSFTTEQLAAEVDALFLAHR
jgi:hypothetical protein